MKISRILTSESGAVTMEVAAFMVFALAVFAGVVDYSAAVQQTVRVEEAAEAGVAYGMIPGNEANTSGMVAAAKAAAAGIPNFNATAGEIWTCQQGQPNAVAPTSTCYYPTSAGTTISGTPMKYIVVITTATLPPIYAYPGLTSSRSINWQAFYRVPWNTQ